MCDKVKVNFHDLIQRYLDMITWYRRILSHYSYNLSFSKYFTVIPSWIKAISLASKDLQGFPIKSAWHFERR